MCIKVNDKITDWFSTTAGVRQGQNDSPTYFAILLNSLAKDIKSSGIGVKISTICITILLYADDIALLAEGEEDLQKLLNILTTGDVLAEGATRALGKILAKYYTNKGLGYETYTKLYNSCISPIMDYCSGIWGRQNNDNILKVHNRAIRCFLGVNKYAPIAGFQGDMGWIWPQVRHKIEMLRYWNRILQLEQGRLPKQLFDFMKELNFGWMNDVKDIFKQINCTV